MSACAAGGEGFGATNRPPDRDALLSDGAGLQPLEDQLQGGLDRGAIDGVAADVAEIVARVHDFLSMLDDGDMNPAGGFVRPVASRARNPGFGNTDLGVRRGDDEGTDRHGADDGCADGSVIDDQRVRHVEEQCLGGVGVGDVSPFDDDRGTGNRCEYLGDHATGRGFRDDDFHVRRPAGFVNLLGQGAESSARNRDHGRRLQNRVARAAGTTLATIIRRPPPQRAGTVSREGLDDSPFPRDHARQPPPAQGIDASHKLIRRDSHRRAKVLGGVAFSRKSADKILENRIRQQDDQPVDFHGQAVDAIRLLPGVRIRGPHGHRGKHDGEGDHDRSRQRRFSKAESLHHRQRTIRRIRRAEPTGNSNCGTASDRIARRVIPLPGPVLRISSAAAPERTDDIMP